MAKAPKKRGGILGAIMNEVMEDKPGTASSSASSSPPPAPTPTVAPMLAGMGAQPAPVSFLNTQPAPAPAPAPAPVFTPAPAPSAAAAPGPFTHVAQEPIDPAALEVAQREVLPDMISGRPSRYVLFVRMWEALGRPADASAALKALQVTDPTMTAQAVSEDLKAHLALMDTAEKNAATEFDRIARDKLGGIDEQIGRLQSENAHAQAEIERHQRETADRSAAMGALQQSRASDEAAIQRGRQRITAAQGVVRAQLLQAQQTLAR